MLTLEENTTHREFLKIMLELNNPQIIPSSCYNPVLRKKYERPG